MGAASSVEIFGTICLALAVGHTFSVKWFQHWARSYPEGSVGENLLHLLGEVEVVFGVWAGIFLAFLAGKEGLGKAVQYLEAQNFTEPAFVFVIMVVCATRPVLAVATGLIDFCSKLLPFNRPIAFFCAALTVGPLLGSFITEPAAMTVTALVLLKRFYERGISTRLMYATIGLLFVNVSIGGTLTPYAAPPILMVAAKWNWDLSFMLSQFGWKAALAVLLSTSVVALRFRNELGKLSFKEAKSTQMRTPFWLCALYLAILAGVVIGAHHMVVFMGIFMFFLGVSTVTKEYQDPIRLREGLLVGFFLGGIVVMGGQQRWWLEPVLSSLTELPLFLGAIGLTAVTDNAALTYLGSQVPSLSEASRYALTAGAVVGGGLSVIANAPNPAGFGILNASFGEEGISPLGLLFSAAFPTVVSALCFWFL